MADRKGGRTWNKPNNGSRDGGKPRYTHEDFRNALDPNVDLDGEIQSAKKNLVTQCQVSKSGCKETLDKEKMKVRK